MSKRTISAETITERKAEQARLVREAYERQLARAEQEAGQLRIVNSGDAS